VGCRWYPQNGPDPLTIELNHSFQIENGVGSANTGAVEIS